MEHKKLTPLFFFLSLGTVVTLIVTVSAFLTLAFETLNHVFRDVLTDSYTYGYANYSYEGMRSALALLIIIFPTYLVIQYFWSKQSTVSRLSHWNDVLRRWALYVILFLVSITIITDLVVLVRYFVSGEITTRFIFKVLLTLLVAIKIGLYYTRTLQEKRVFIVAHVVTGSIAVLALIVWSFSVIGSPVHQRKLRIDQKRIDDLQSIQYQVINYWQQKEMLPVTIAQLNNPLSSYMVPTDPEFEKGKQYLYTKISDKEFQLCASFDLPLAKGWVPDANGQAYPGVMDTSVSSYPYVTNTTDSWDHQAGDTCFMRTIDPDVYPPYPKAVKG